MANAAYKYIELNDNSISEPERAILAAQAIAKVYEESKDLLSKNAKILYAINIPIIEDKAEKANEHSNNEFKPFTRILTKHNGTKNRRPGKGHRNH